MNNENLSIMRQSRLFQGVLATFGAIILGAIGSGLWDVFLSPIFNWAGDRLLTAASWAFGSFADSMYRQVSRDPTNFAKFPYIVLMISGVTLPWLLSVFLLINLGRIRRSLNESPSRDIGVARDDMLGNVFSRSKLIIRLILPLALFTSLLYASTFYQDLHSWRAAIWVERCLAIVAPHLKSSESLQLQAKFRAIEKASDFYELEDQLRSIAGEHAISLPEFESIR
ncbi:MAG: hypothetical protein EPO31_01945 [Gammaproteobacteria bacterium]|nr:MAG: hypothetical protein EPO31_01945 [Gammaproteobacteria bacterium]